MPPSTVSSASGDALTRTGRTGPRERLDDGRVGDRPVVRRAPAAPGILAGLAAIAVR